ADEHFGRRRHQKFAVAEIHQRAIGRRIDAAQPLEHFRRRALAGFGEQLPGHRLKEIATCERGACGLYCGLVFAGRVVGKSLPRRVRWPSAIGAVPQMIWPARRFWLFSEMTTQGSRKTSARNAIRISPRAFNAVSEKFVPVVSNTSGGSEKPRSKLS